MSSLDLTIKALWVALCMMLALLVGVAAGILAWLGGQDPPAAILIGGGAFGGTVTLALTIKNALSDLRSGSAGQIVHGMRRDRLRRAETQRHVTTSRRACRGRDGDWRLPETAKTDVVWP